MDPDEITYDQATMTQLYESLNTEGSQIFTEIDDINNKTNQLLEATKGEGATEGIQAAHSKISGELHDTKVKLDDLGAKVEDALHRALGTDQKIGDGFAAFG